jgi:integrase
VLNISAYTRHTGDAFKLLIKDVVSREYIYQKTEFIRGNSKQLDVGKDIWRIYYLDGENLRSYRCDFSLIEPSGLKLELKYYYKNILGARRAVRIISLISALINRLAQAKHDLHSFADLTEADTAFIYSYLENEYVSSRGDNVSPKTIQMTMCTLKAVGAYLIGIDRDKRLKTPVPERNHFEKYIFRNIDNMHKPTEPLPEVVAEGILEHIHKLSDKDRIMIKLFMNSGLRAKEAALLKTDCIGSELENGCVELKYTPYKVLSQRRKINLTDESTVLIPKDLANELSEYIRVTQAVRGDSEYAFVSSQYNVKLYTPNSLTIYSMVNRMIAKFNICDEQGKLWKFSNRQFRKTVAVTMIENGASVSEVAYMLGHFGLNAAKRYYDDVRKMKLAQMNTEFFKAKFNIIIDKDRLNEFTEEQRKCLYLDFCLQQRSVELGYCLKPFDAQGCTERNRLNSCVNCRNLCTGGKYLEYWKQLRDEQRDIVDKLIKYYVGSGATDYESFKEFRQERLMLEQYEDVVKRIEKGGAADEK